MNAHNSPVQKSGQHNKLARALTLALGLTISPFALSASGDVAPMATLVVQNCNDTGYGSLRDAVSQASSGDIIDMSALSCSTINLQSTLIISQANLTLRGKASTAPPIIYSPIIETTNNVKLLSHTGAGKLKLSKVTLQKGNATDGIGGCVDSISGSVELDSAALKYCTAERSGNARGGAIYAGADVKLTNSRIMGSKAISGSAIAKGGGIFAKGDVVIFDDSLIRNNTAQGADAYGGGIFAGGKLDAALKRSTISGNKVIAPASSGRAYGGGAFVTGVASVALGAGLQVSGNHATGNNAKGGGLFLSEAGNIKYSSFKNNKAGSGGGIFSKDGTLSLDSCTITGNQTTLASGGGLYASALDLNKSTVSGNNSALSGGGLRVAGDTKIISSTISDNTAVRVAGASLGSGATQPISIQQSTISGNQSSNSKFGAALYLASHTVIKNSTITGNVERNAEEQKYGAGISVRDGITVDLSSTIVSGNTFTSTAGVTNESDIGFAGSATTATLTGSHNMIGFSLVTPMPTGTIQAAPELGPLQDNGGATWTHIPLLGSPAISAGKANAFTTDQRGTGFPRVVGPAPDIGAVEYSVFATEVFSDGFEN